MERETRLIKVNRDCIAAQAMYFAKEEHGEDRQDNAKAAVDKNTHDSQPADAAGLYGILVAQRILWRAGGLEKRPGAAAGAFAGQALRLHDHGHYSESGHQGY